MRKRNLWLWILAPILLGACATLSDHDHTRGTVVLCDDGNEAHVCLGENEVKVGDKVDVFDSTCKKEQVTVILPPRYQTKCEKVLIGQAEVIEVSDEHYSRVRSIGDVVLREHQIVEKIKK